MSKEAFLAAINNKPWPEVPRTEYSAAKHWELIQAVTGIDTEKHDNRNRASQEFIKQWDISFIWSILVNTNFLKERGGRVTDLGHAEYMENDSGQSDIRKIHSNPFRNPEDVYKLDPFEEYGTWEKAELVRQFEEHYTQKCASFPDAVNMSGVYITMVSGLNEIFGFEDMAMAMGLDIDRFNKVVEKYYLWVLQFFEAFAQTSIPVMMIHDDICWTSGPFSYPAWYRENIFPYYKKLWEPVKKAGKKILYTSDGTIDEFFDDIADCGPDMVVMEPTSKMKLFAEKYGDRIGFVGGSDCRTLMGSKEGIRRELEEVMSWAKKYNGYVHAVGNHLPPNVPVENALYYNEIYNKLKTR